MKPILFIAYFVVLVYCSEESSNKTITSTNDDKLEVKIYYETLCIDSMLFFRRKLFPSMFTKNRLKNADLKLIPYGKVEKYQNPTTNKTELMCQHGPKECELNALHACIIENINLPDSLYIINCLMYDYNSDFDSCASYYNVNTDAINACTKSRTIPEILKIYGDDTDSVHITFVPLIGIDKIVNQRDQFRFRTNFDTMFCRKFVAKYNYTLSGCSN